MNYYPVESSYPSIEQEPLAMESPSSPPLQLVLENNAQGSDLRDTAEGSSHAETLRGHVEFASAVPIMIDDVCIYFEGDIRVISEELLLRDE